jgi:hypothetical protein
MMMIIIMDYKLHNLHFSATNLAENIQDVSGKIIDIL